ncbi:uncharacterized protein PHACADRAFT_33224 [Phanerochaete carnosa HHB-10118-sp]|uniref:F-box domain-containing protein n=1 Tax=Phanerochaete carnosa (strain HHB-10118-sp) TaxID=650164 RepID=K5VSA1_PHACS|nr:uncharacterized protein PHACADRAFT_33224 [Phanerochaete carnosa HHB-10118-sp]EKM49655.1 hypothetical protein PHACADRAFT_33224 [Phanerochaete carnosa HHB-10118-sp]
MAEAKLPEEIIREILTLILPPFCAKTFLKFPLESRRPCWAQERPGALEEGGTNVLLISKRWLRIATPLLYQGVALRKSRHTSAVARLVKADPAVGRAIRYLRLEGGSMTRELSTLVKHAPNIHTVYVSEQMRTGESLDGLQRAMSLLRPTTLYIHLLAQTLHNWRAVREDEIALKAVVEVWPSIVSPRCTVSSRDRSS